ncbi:Pycsar system effector family protein [Nonomuraea lactucae]|uniref:Pycsar system effector family protein n=1 Tax=Nonomuraea lactucae TaxID=2249762 RepID=UPI000DE22F19|nr:Pycsar system effector family protein [Nonomuraea lactucae]
MARADDAWKALSLVIDLIKHAETKAGLTLAACGAVGGVMYTMVRSVPQPSAWFGIAAAACALLVIGGACCAGLALVPRLRGGPVPANLLYYRHIAAHYLADSGAYAGELGTLLKNPDALVASIADQVWSNSRVARQKYHWAGLAINALLLALAALALTAAIGVFQSP